MKRLHLYLASAFLAAGCTSPGPESPHRDTIPVGNEVSKTKSALNSTSLSGNRVRKRYYRIDGPDFWGDYGTFLAGGMVVPPFPGEEAPENAPLIIERVGPFMPPVTTTSNELLVTDDMKNKLAKFDRNVRFRSVVKQKIVSLDWREWREAGDMPLSRVPASGEPEGFVNDYEHSPEASEALGTIWQLLLPSGAEGKYVPTERRFVKQLVIDSESIQGYDFCTVTPTVLPVPVVSERAKEWLEQHAEGWLSFEPVDIR